jgi:hypothetical protein
MGLANACGGRWAVAIAASACAFAMSRWVCQAQVRLDEGALLGVAGAVLAVVLAVMGWWAAQERRGGEDPRAAGPKVLQKARGDRDVNMAGHDQTIINYQQGDD